MFRALVVRAHLRRGHGVVSLVTKPKPESELVGLVYGCTDIPSEGDMPSDQRPDLLGRRSGAWFS